MVIYDTPKKGGGFIAGPSINCPRVVLKSPLLLIEPADWEIAIFLPTESFRKVDKNTVWSESRSKF